MRARRRMKWGRCTWVGSSFRRAVGITMRLFLAGSLLLLTGCSTVASVPAKFSDGFVWLALDHEYRAANRTFKKAIKQEGKTPEQNLMWSRWAFRRGKGLRSYGEAATAYENLLGRYPESGRREKMLFNLGLVYFRMQDYHDAAETFLTYRERYPDGRYFEESALNITRVQVAAAEPHPETQELLERSKDQLEQLLDLEQTYPANAQVKYYLGGAYYTLEEFNMAAQKYNEAVTLDAAYHEKELIENQMYVNEDGVFAALTPEVRERLRKDRDPVVVYDVNKYFSSNRLSQWTPSADSVIVTGLVRNQGSETLRNVQLEVRFLDAVRKILDVKFVNIGVLAPETVHSFIVQGARYDTLYNIREVQIIPRIDR